MMRVTGYLGEDPKLKVDAGAGGLRAAGPP
jgi:hypothetical protein